MTSLLDGQTAVVTGAASGNGRGIAIELANHGADIVVADVREEPRKGGRTTHEVIRDETTARATHVVCDVTDPSDHRDVMDVAEEFGGVDIMVNNAGIVGDECEMVDLDVEQYREVMRVNLDGAVYGSQVAADRMIARSTKGSIINVCSLASFIGHHGIGPYSMSKGGLKLLTYTLATELGKHGIRVNAVHPGVIETALIEDMDVDEEMAANVTQSIPLQRLGTPNDVGSAVVYLASDLAGYVTGESHLVDGGMTNTVSQETR